MGMVQLGTNEYGRGGVVQYGRGGVVRAPMSVAGLVSGVWQRWNSTSTHQLVNLVVLTENLQGNLPGRTQLQIIDKAQAGYTDMVW